MVYSSVSKITTDSKKRNGPKGRTIWRRYEKEFMDKIIALGPYPDKSVIESIAVKLGRKVS